MRIAIDGNEANVEKRVGISEYAYWLLFYFSKFSTQSDELSFTVYLKNKPLSSMPPESSLWKYKVFGPSKMWTQIALPSALVFEKQKPDVFFSLTHYAPRFSPVPTIVSVMDLSYVYFPELFKKTDLYQLRNWTIYSVKNARRVITISKSSRNDIIKEYGLPANKVVSIYPGIKQSILSSSHSVNMNELKSKYQLDDDFFLFVGTLQPRKNIIKLIEAFDLVLKDKKTHKKLQLVIVGKKGWLYEEILDKPAILGIQDRVKFLETITDDELVLLYKSAICFILPSLYEGFGLPILEAMQNDCPVITSNISSLPEAGGDAALYVDPYDASDIARKMVTILTDVSLRNSLIAKGKIQITKFSWETSAKEALQVIKDVVNGNKNEN